MSRRGLVISVLVALAVLAGAGVWLWSSDRADRARWTDGGAIREPAGTARVRSALWTPPQALPGVINSGEECYEPKLSPDGQTLYFVRGKAGGNAEIFAALRTAEGWSEPEPLAAVNSPEDDLGPEPSADGRRLYFYSNRPGGQGGYDLWVARRGGDGVWGEPENLGPGVNTPFNEYNPAADPDGKTLYFASNRPRAGEMPAGAPATWPATVRERLVKHDYDLYAIGLGADGAPVAGGDRAAAGVRGLTELNTGSNEGTPAVSPAGDFLYFSSDREGGSGGLDLWRSRIGRGGLERPENLGSAVNSAWDDLDPGLSMGGFGLHFSSSRPREMAEAGAETGTFSIFWSVSREVYRETEPRRPIDWAGLWAAAWPYLMWLLILLLALLALIRLIKEARQRKLGILTKCLLASLVLHIILMFALNLWGVGTAVGELFGRAGGTKVHISEAAGLGSGAEAIVGQVRGGLMDASITVPEAGPLADAPLLAAPDAANMQAAIDAAATKISAEAPLSAAAPSEAPVREVAAAPRPTFDTVAATPRVAVPEVPSPVEAREAGSPAVEASRPEALRPSVSGEGIRISPTELGVAPAAVGSETPLALPGGTREASPTVASAAPRASVPVGAGATQTALPSAAPAAAGNEASAQIRAPASGGASAPVPVPVSGGAATPVMTVAPGPAAVGNEGVIVSPEPREATAAGSPAAVAKPARITEATGPAAANVALPAGEAKMEGREAAVSPGLAGALSGAGPSPSPAAGVQGDPHGAVNVGAAPARVEGGSTLAGVEAGGAAEAKPGETGKPGLGLAARAPSVDTVPAGPLALPRESATGLGRVGGTEVQAAVMPAAGGGSGLVAPPAAAPSGGPSGAMRVGAAPSRVEPGATLAGNGGSPSDARVTDSRPSAGLGLASRASAPDAAPLGGVALPREVAGAGGKTGGGEAGPTVDTGLGGAPGLVPRVAPGRGEFPAVSKVPRPAPSSVGEGSMVTPRALAERGAAAAADRDTRMPAMPGGILKDLGGPGLRLPTETAPPASAYAQRAPEQREQIVQRLGGSADTEKAVNLALRWLAEHQSPDGRWSGEHFDDHCGECGDESVTGTDAAQTGLALLCFLAADHTHMKEGPYREVVGKGLRWLLKQQSADGDLRHEEAMYSHGIATIALSEAYGITKDPELKGPVESAVKFIIAARNTKQGGWRYDPGQAGDTSVLGWQVMALTSARRAGIDVPESVFDAAREWLDKVALGEAKGLYAYQPRQAPTPSMTAEGLFAQQLLGRGRDEPRMKESVELLGQNPPRWKRGGSTYYWYYATLALFQEQGEAWTKWNGAVSRALVENQQKEGKAAGSWDPWDRWSRSGGRVYQTAVCTLCLEVYYRYLPLYGVNK